MHYFILTFYYYTPYINIIPYLLEVVAVFHKPFIDGSYTALAASFFVPYKVFAMLVNSIVSQMHAHFILTEQIIKKRKGEHE